MKTQGLAYRDVRDQIQTGDLLLYSGHHPISRIIQWGTGSQYSHSGMAAWWRPCDTDAVRRLMVCEATHPYVTLRPASQSVGAYWGTVDWYPLKAEYRKQLHMAVFEQEAVDRLGLQFSVGGLFDNLFDLLKLKFLAARHRGNQVFCSEYVSECFSMALKDPVVNEPNHFTSPEALSKSPLWSYAGCLHLSVHEKNSQLASRRALQRQRLAERPGDAKSMGEEIQGT